jgi:hypothetical protein
MHVGVRNSAAGSSDSAARLHFNFVVGALQKNMLLALFQLPI